MKPSKLLDLLRRAKAAALVRDAATAIGYLDRAIIGTEVHIGGLDRALWRRSTTGIAHWCRDRAAVRAVCGLRAVNWRPTRGAKVRCAMCKNALTRY